MNILDAELCFKKGLVALVEDVPERAAAMFHNAMKIEKERRTQTPQMRYLSYYGLSMARARGVTQDVVRACETAARRDFFNPDLQLNLGRVYLLSGQVSRALAAFERGLRLAPGHRGLRAEMLKVNRRQRRPIRRLPRSHPINCFLGRLRTRVPRWLATGKDAVAS